MPRDTLAKQSLGIDLTNKIHQSRVLMVGAGGIGCELLKNLVLMGFGEIHVVDLDTIDLSNLNRQFLFRKEHIQQPKAHVAKEAALKFNPNVKIESYHANIKDSQFSRIWFKSFDIVFNALDNIDARKYVNKMCISVDVPLIESGTTGFEGQAYIIKKGITACYECDPRETPKTFPVCTIRNTPSQPIHCIVWAKSYLFTEIFGAGAEAAQELNFETTGENKEQMQKLVEEQKALQNIRESMGSKEFSGRVFNKVFNDDIKTSLTMEDMWKGKRKPEAMSYSDFAETEIDQSVAKKDQEVWSREQCLQVFNDSIQRLSERYIELKGSEDPNLEFDKDDVDTLDFVAAAANLRCYVFGLEAKSKFDIKQMAGNIIPAIATTNAIIAGACVLQAIKVFQGEYLLPGSFTTSKLSYRLMGRHKKEPNPDCPVCSSAQTQVKIQPTATLGNLVEGLRSTLGYTEVEIYSEQGLIYEEDDDENDDMLIKKLSDLEIGDGTFLRIIEKPRVELILNIETDDAGDESVRIAKVEIPTRAPSPETNGNGVQTQNESLTNGNSDSQAGSLKRSADEELQGPVKSKLKMDNDGAIVLD